MSNALIQPTDIDVLCGRGKSYITHAGNSQFNQIIQSNLQKYRDAPRRIDRSLLIASLVDEFFDAGSRFLKRDKATNEWVELNADQCHEKLGHALRDLLRKSKHEDDNYRQQSQSGAVVAARKKHQRDERGIQNQQHEHIRHRALSLSLLRSSIISIPNEDMSDYFGTTEALHQFVTPKEEEEFGKNQRIPTFPPIRMVSYDSSVSSSFPTVSLQNEKSVLENPIRMVTADGRTSPPTSVSYEDDDIVPLPCHYWNRNSFRSFSTIDDFVSCHDLTQEESLADFQF